ncbi:type II secretion system protein GspM [Thalassolituus sp. LLYu03]|uniref:type II secretion system protein GspM n=1 Tax=Thalassolituus sp. LLYu03 TaxID=3421656 RepID=UPI003D27DB72
MNRLTELQEQMLQKVKASPQWQQAAHWYQALPARDQMVVRLVGWLMVAALVFLIIYAPLIKSQRASEAALGKNIGVYNMLAENAHRFGGGNSGAAQGPLLATVMQQAKASGITLSRYEQDGKSLRVWLERVPFDDAIGWLEQLQASKGVHVSQINIDRGERPGVVDIRATLNQ